MRDRKHAQPPKPVGSLTPQIASMLNLAVTQYQGGQLPAMRETCRLVLAIDPQQVHALHLLGISFLENQPDEAEKHIRQAITLGSRDPVHYANLGSALDRQNRFEEALAMYEKALRRNPRYPEAHVHRGMTLRSLGRLDEAIAAFGAALALRADLVSALSQRSGTLLDLRRFEEAFADCDRLLAISQKDVPALHNRGFALQQLGRFEEALIMFDRALALQPGRADTHWNRGITLRSLGRLEEALAAFDSALLLQTDYAAARKTRADTLLDLHRYREAIAEYDRVLSLRPGDQEALNNRAVACVGAGDPAQALDSIDLALASGPESVELINTRGGALKNLHRFDEALECFDRVIALAPDHKDAITNRATVLVIQGRFEEALAAYAAAQRLQPDFADAIWGEGGLRLLLGDLPRGFAATEWRFAVPALKLARPGYSRPLWNGDASLAGKTIYVYPDQGLGDTIHFARYIPLLAGRGARVIATVQPPLRSLVGTIEGIADCKAIMRPETEFDLHCPLPSLPFAFGTTLDSIPASVPYMRASPLSPLWRERLAPARRPLIGLVWAGNPTHKDDFNRSIPFDMLRPLLDCEATFVSLQTELRAGDEAAMQAHGNLIAAGRFFGDFSDTAALVNALDLVITVDTSVAHLAGALAKPVWILLPCIPDWRWLLEREDSPWYPTARLFRQSVERRWEPVIERVRQELGAMLGALR